MTDVELAHTTTVQSDLMDKMQSNNSASNMNTPFEQTKKQINIWVILYHVAIWSLLIYSVIVSSYTLQLITNCDCINQSSINSNSAFGADSTTEPTLNPTKIPSISPSNNPSLYPSSNPSSIPTYLPTSLSSTEIPSANPTVEPSYKPSNNPTVNPTNTPSQFPSNSPSMIPTNNPSMIPTNNPSVNPTNNPSMNPTATPSGFPTKGPSINPTTNPTKNPSMNPTTFPTQNPSISPSMIPTNLPTLSPTIEPTYTPTTEPTFEPTIGPSIEPTLYPTPIPTVEPTNYPTNAPTISVGAIIQIQRVISHTKITISTHSSWIEPSTDYRVSITPKYVDSEILISYNFGWNGYGIATNTIILWSAAKSVGGGSFNRNTITSSGVVSGSRQQISGIVQRRNNGQDANDMNFCNWMTYDHPNSTQQITYSLNMYQENVGAGALRIGESNSNDGRWGWNMPVSIIVMEIKN